MEDKFGNIKEEALIEYYKMLIGRVYKLLPMKENQEDVECWKKERDKLIRTYEANRATIATRENNIGFLSLGKSKEGNPLVDEMLKQIEKLKKEQVELVKKIKALEEKIRNAEEN